MAILAPVEQHKLPENRRYGARRVLSLGSVLTDSGAEITIRDLSQTGLLIETSRELQIGESLLINIPERGTTPAEVVWRSGRYFGCEFKLSIPVAAVSAALLRSPVHCADRFAIKSNPALQAYEDEEVEVAPQDDRYSLRTRAAVLLGLVGVSWTVIGSVIAWWI